MSWYELYMKNSVTKQSLQRLVDAGKMSQKELDDMVQERLDKHGY